MRYRMGDLVELVTETNSDLQYGLDDIVGVTLEKQMIPTIANLTQTNLDDFIIVRPKYFVYNPRTHGKKIGLGFNTTDRCFISTWNNNTFRVKPEMSDVIIPEFLYMHFLRERWDKEACFNAWGSSTVVLLWSSFCDMKINVPPISEQRKIVHDYQVITDRIELLRKMNENLTEQMMAIYRNHFVDFQPFNSESFKNTKLGDIPASWRTGKLSEICEMLNGRAYSQDEMLLEGKYKLLRVGNFFTNDFWYYSDLELDDNKYCYPGDLLFCWAATLGLYIWNEPKTIYHYHIWKVDFSRSSSLYREYVYLCLTNEMVNMKNAGHGSIMLHLTKENVENMEIIIPPFQTIKEFHNIVVPYINQRNIIQKELNVLAGLKNEVLMN